MTDMYMASIWRNCLKINLNKLRIDFCGPKMIFSLYEALENFGGKLAL